MAHGAFDEVRREVVMFGGDSTPSPLDYSCGGTSLDETWTWDGVAWTKRAPTTVPPARKILWMTWDPTGQRVLMGSGCSASAPGGFTDLWAWDGANWSSITSSAFLGGSFMFAFSKDAGVAFVEGGPPATPPTTYRWSGSVFNGGGFTYSPAPTIHAKEGLLYEAWSDTFIALLSPAACETGSAAPWQVSLSDQVWLGRAATTRRYLFGKTVDSLRHRVVLFGGDNCSLPNLRDAVAWTPDGGAGGWTTLQSCSSGTCPLGRREGLFIYDSARDVFVLFGGVPPGPTAPLNDTWELRPDAGWTWSQR